MSSTKPGKRRIGREAAIQFLYSNEVNDDTNPEQIDAFWKLRPLRPDARAFATELVIGVLRHREAIDSVLTKKLENYRLERLAAVDRNILRLAIYEILFREDVPNPVVINEAIEIAKRFASTDSSSFVNGLLDSIRKSQLSTQSPES